MAAEEIAAVVERAIKFVSSNPGDFKAAAGNIIKAVLSGAKDIVSGFSAGVAESGTAGISRLAEPYLEVKDNKLFLSGKIIGNLVAGTIAAGGTAGGALMSATGAGAVVGVPAAAYEAGVVVSSAGNLLANAAALSAIALNSGGGASGPGSGGGGGSGGGSPQRMTTKEATEAAEKLGYKKTNYYTKHGEAIYYSQKSGTYISHDNTAHNGGIWKMAKTIKELDGKTTRMGTYDANLNRIGR
jgi:hypothetical protein